MLDDGDRVLVRLRRLQGVELAAEELNVKEMTVPSGQPLGEHLPVTIRDSISRADVAQFVIHELEHGDHLLTAPTVAAT